MKTPLYRQVWITTPQHRSHSRQLRLAAAAAIRAAGDVDACPALSSDFSGGGDDDDADAVAAWACAGGRRAERAYRGRSVDPEACSALDGPARRRPGASARRLVGAPARRHPGARAAPRRPVPARFVPPCRNGRGASGEEIESLHDKPKPRLCAGSHDWKNYAEITQKLRRNCAEITHVTQKLRRNYADYAEITHVTQKLRKNYAEITQELRKNYAKKITQITQKLRVCV